MKIFNSLEEIKDIEETVVALGNFDGVHRGHQQIIERTVKNAEAAGLKSAVFTFSNHTRTLLKNVPPVKNILYAEEKAEIIESLGIDYLFNIPFTREIMNMSPERFVQEILVDKFRIREAYCGFNYTFGHKAQGTPEVLMQQYVHQRADQGWQAGGMSQIYGQNVCYRWRGRSGKQAWKDDRFSNVKHYDR